MTKRINTPEPDETVTIAKSSLDNIFLVLEEMSREIAELKAMVRKSPDDDPIFNSVQAAKYCGCTRQTIYAWARKKKIHRSVRGGKRGFLKSELDKISNTN